jgi:glycerol-3-phosphate dehydrogenase
MALNPMDFFIRRTGRLYFNIDSVRKYMEPVLEEFQTAYGYSSEEMAAFRAEMEGELKKHSNFSLDRD